MFSSHSWFGFFSSWWGVILLAALDTSVFVFVPFGNDALVVYLAARNQDSFWLYPLLATAGSVLGAGVTFWIGNAVGEAGLDRFVSRHRLDRLKRLEHTGAVALALPTVLPPPFPLTALVLTSGALGVNRTWFFAVFAGARLVRFGLEALLARLYGAGVLQIMESPTFTWVVAAFIVVALGGTAASASVAWRRTPGHARSRTRRVR
jgi:membrane protein YqaA with SNARE-associated domain